MKFVESFIKTALKLREMWTFKILRWEPANLWVYDITISEWNTKILNKVTKMKFLVNKMHKPIFYFIKII